MFLLSGFFAATTTTIREGRAAFPDFVFGVLADGGVLFDSEERGKLCQKINPFFFSDYHRTSANLSNRCGMG